ncbi:MAG: VTT domain-containing protein [Silvanigrellaceae bacterium]|nr:VTT domain-containing protein [Silvanigrellaceae bacterium]
MFVYLNQWIEFIIDSIKNPFSLIYTVGFWGLCFIVFAETGILAGFFLPGDSLLVAAGLVASQGMFNIWELAVALVAAAILGDALGYFIGKKLGESLFRRNDSFFFRKKHLEKTQEFYHKHGGKTIILARFIPILRTFAPTVAGMAGMNYRKFLFFNAIGGFFWIFSMLLTGYYAGKAFGDKMIENIHYIILGVIIVSFMPLIIEWLKHKKKSLNR